MAAASHSQMVRRLQCRQIRCMDICLRIASPRTGCLQYLENNVGQKTYGLSLPKAWTLPYVAVSKDLHANYSSSPQVRQKLLATWCRPIIDAALKSGIKLEDGILVRSSGCAEGIARRGKFHSSIGVLNNIETAIAECLNKLAADGDLQQECIPLLIQKRCQPEFSKGHLSNERRCYEETRDWMGEMELSESSVASPFQINIRHWRKDIQIELNTELFCSLSAYIPEVLKATADWAHRKRARVHFEWVWDGSRVYLVQADEESQWDGHNPVQEHNARSYNAVVFEPQCLTKVTANIAKRFNKTANAFVYMKLNLPTVPLYILEDPVIVSKNCNWGYVRNLTRRSFSTCKRIACYAN